MTPREASEGAQEEVSPHYQNTDDGEIITTRQSEEGVRRTDQRWLLQPDSQGKVVRHPDQRWLQNRVPRWRMPRKKLKPPQETRRQDPQSQIFLRKDK